MESIAYENNELPRARLLICFPCSTIQKSTSRPNISLNLGIKYCAGRCMHLVGLIIIQKVKEREEIAQ